MNLICKKCFLKADIVSDRFHVQQLANDAVQKLRIEYRWAAIDDENERIAKEKEEAKKLDTNKSDTTVMVKEINQNKQELFENGDNRRQLLARSRYLLFKCSSKWTISQAARAKILFKEYPDLERAYNLADGLRHIFNQSIEKDIARTKLAQWAEMVRQARFKSFNTVANTINSYYDQITNYFNNRCTNASAESFNAKIKDFRSRLRGIADTDFFLFRLTKIYA